jgi:small conductance mechanosensitive channel
MTTTIPPIIEDILLSIFVLIATMALSWIASEVILSRMLAKTTKIAAKWIARIVQYIIFTFGLYIVIYHILALDLRTFAASLGIIGIAVAFSSQQVIQNAIAGILITIRRPVQLEDWIEVAASGVCRVRDIGLLQTEVRGTNGRLIYIPNSVLLNSMIINYTKAGASMITIPMMLPQGLEFDEVKGLLINAAKDIVPPVEPAIRRRHKILQKLAPQVAALMETKKTVRSFEPQVIITDISNGRITINIRIWTGSIERREEIISLFLQKVMADSKEKKIALYS